MGELTPKQRFTAALKREKIQGLVPTFELVFFLTMEAFGKVHHANRNFGNWQQMSKNEQKAHIDDIAKTYIMTAEKYGHDCIMVHAGKEDAIKIMTSIREMSGDKYFLVMHGDATTPMPDGAHMLQYSYRMADEPEKMKEESYNRVNRAIDSFYDFTKNHPGLLDGLALCDDYCFNSGPFWSPSQFSEFVAPYLQQEIKGYRDLGLYTIKHTDGNIMPIIDQLVQAEPDALHSLDPQGGVDLGVVKKMYGDRVTLCGNVNCGLLQTGTDEEVIADVKRALEQGMQGGTGYIFCTSNCVYNGMELSRYELMMDIYHKYGVYK